MKIASYILSLTLIILTLIVDCHELTGQDTENLKYDKSGNIKYLKFDEDKKIVPWSAPSSSVVFFSNILGVKEPNKFALKTKLEHKDGSYCEIYNQTYNNIEVERGIYSLQFANGKMSKANGHFVKIEGIITNPKLTPEEASRAYSKYLKVPDSVTIQFLYGIVIAEIKEISANDIIYKAKLCYKIDLLDKTWDNGKTGYIDAQSGDDVLKTVRRYNDNSATGTFNTLYNSTVSAGTQFYNNSYNLCDSSRGAVIHTWDLNDTYFANYSSNLFRG